MNPIVAAIWHFGGLAAVLVGTSMLAGLPGFLIGLGSWAILATMSDLTVRELKRKIGS